MSTTMSAPAGDSAASSRTPRMAIIGGRLEDNNKAVYGEMRRLARGRIPAYTEIAFPVAGNGPAAGAIVPVRVTGRQGQRLAGVAAQETERAA